MAERPTEIACEICGVMVPVAPKGRIPKRCDEHRGAKAQPPTGPAVTGLEWPRHLRGDVWQTSDGRSHLGEGHARGHQHHLDT